MYRGAHQPERRLPPLSAQAWAAVGVVVSMASTTAFFWRREELPELALYWALFPCLQLVASVAFRNSRALLPLLSLAVTLQWLTAIFLLPAYLLGLPFFPAAVVMSRARRVARNRRRLTAAQGLRLDLVSPLAALLIALPVSVLLVDGAATRYVLAVGGAWAAGGCVIAVVRHQNTKGAGRGQPGPLSAAPADGG